MKTNIAYAPIRTPCAREKLIELKLQQATLVIGCIALAVGGCETMDVGSSGPQVAVVAPSSPAAFGQTAYTGGPGFAVGLGGRWYHDGNATSINVAPDGRNLTIINEQGRRSDGYATSPREIEIPSLRIRGHVSHSGRRISWTNGTEWTREPRKSGSEFGQRPAQDLNGRWYHDGKPTSISVSSGGSVTITNEHGQSSFGNMSGNDIQIRGGLRGHVGHNGRRISWNNGTTWTR
jgi:hypothetical protein